MGARAAAGAYPVSSSFGGAASVTSENAPASQPEIATSILKRQLFPFSDVDAKPTKLVLVSLVRLYRDSFATKNMVISSRNRLTEF